MVNRSWSKSGRPAGKANIRANRSLDSWAVALDRARREWDGLTGGPGGGATVSRAHAGLRVGYSEAAADGILRLAVALWPVVAAELAEGAAPD